MSASRRQILLRRAAALGVVIGLTLAIWALFVRDDGGEDGEFRERPPGLSARIAELGRSLGVEEQAQQVLLIGFDGTDPSAPLVMELRELQLGGVLVQPQNWSDAASGTALVDALREAGDAGQRVPPLLVTAQEGGEYRALADLPPAERALEIGDRGSPERAQAWARETASALRQAGFDLNLFPIADVATLDSPVADRAFSDDAFVAAALTGAAIRGCTEAGLACAPAHFPGLGAASQDTAEGPATVSLDAGTLESRDLQPFRAARAEGAPAMVLSLALYAAYDPVTPGALAAPVAGGLLRDELRFQGAAITDDLSSGAIRAAHRVPDAAVLALAAGADLVQISDPREAGRARNAIVAAVEAGELDEARLAEAAARVLELKRGLGLLPE